MAIKINAQVTGYGRQPANMPALVIVTVEFDGPSEAMTFTVLVPNDGDESSRAALLVVETVLIAAVSAPAPASSYRSGSSGSS